MLGLLTCRLNSLPAKADISASLGPAKMPRWFGWEELAPMLQHGQRKTRLLGLASFLMSIGSAQRAAHLVGPLAPAGALPKGATNLIWGRSSHQLILHIHLPPATPTAAN